MDSMLKTILNLWKQNQGGSGRGNEPQRAPNQNPPQNIQPSNVPNFSADPDAFGPPLGGRRQNRNQGGQNRNQARKSIWFLQTNIHFIFSYATKSAFLSAILVLT